MEAARKAHLPPNWLAIPQLFISRQAHKGTSLLCGHVGPEQHTAPPQPDNVIVARELESRALLWVSPVQRAKEQVVRRGEATTHLSSQSGPV